MTTDRAHPPKRLRDLLVPADRLRYLAWRLLRSRSPIRIRLAGGPRLILRPWPAMDIGVAHEVFALGVYDLSPDLVPRDARRIVDLGANTGISCVYWLHRYPQAQLTAFEPHPTYCDLVRRNIAINGWSDRATIHEAAACCGEESLYLTDAESFSSVTSGPGKDAVPEVMADFVARTGGVQVDTTPRDRIAVRGLDFFKAVGDGPIQLLKIDIEGGEHALLDDPRFEALDAAVIALEWHDTDAHPDGLSHCRERLTQMGYRIDFESPPVTLGQGPRRVGILHAVRGAGPNPR